MQVVLKMPNGKEFEAWEGGLWVTAYVPITGQEFIDYEIDKHEKKALDFLSERMIGVPYAKGTHRFEIVPRDRSKLAGNVLQIEDEGEYLVHTKVETRELIERGTIQSTPK